MDSMDNVREQIEALAQQTEQLKHQTQALEARTRSVARRLRWWRGIACGVIVLALVGFPLQSGKAQYEDKGLAQRVKDLEYKLLYVTGGDNEVVITGANLRIVNGLGATDTTNGLGNLIVGYNELRQGNPNCPTGFPCIDTRTGSHNMVVGTQHNFSSFGGLVVGFVNELRGEYASVSGGRQSVASGNFSSVSGGFGNAANGDSSSVSGGSGNLANGNFSSVSGGVFNVASGGAASVTGGFENEAQGIESSVSGGEINMATGLRSSISCGSGISFVPQDGLAAGSFGGDVSGRFRSP